ncbi:MAG: 4Fe-4S binding protein [Deltaproteobacteria bacterium]|nr:4Fe-4S binding protein [Deltaproteobacteria bacterium]
MKIRRTIIAIDEETCNGCGQCIPACAEGAIRIINGKATVVSETFCDGLGACLAACPQDALRIVEREADEFDPEAAAKNEETEKALRNNDRDTMSGNCPSAHCRVLVSSDSPPEKDRQAPHNDRDSALTHWPVKIRLISPGASFLENADLLVAADCTPLAYPHFHDDFIKGRIVLAGCPKFDDAEAYGAKFAEIFHANPIKSITVAVMEVPCCGSLPMIVQKGMKRSGKRIPLKTMVLSLSGRVLGTKKYAA